MKPRYQKQAHADPTCTTGKPPRANATYIQSNRGTSTPRVNLALSDSSGLVRGRPLWYEILWHFIGSPLLRTDLIPNASFKRVVLRCFGAKIGLNVNIKPGVKVKFPWYLTVGDQAWIGERVWIDNLAPVQIGPHACVSQGCYLCTGNHDWASANMKLTRKPIVLGEGSWVAARSVILPGVTVGAMAIVTAGSVVSHDVPPLEVHAGNPARLSSFGGFRISVEAGNRRCEQRSTTVKSMPNLVLIDYGAHSFTHHLVQRLHLSGFAVRYLTNGSLESPNLSSLGAWRNTNPDIVRIITCQSPYGKLNLTGRVKGEIEWASACTRALAEESPQCVVASCLPLIVALRVRRWCAVRSIPFIYWLQDLQALAIAELLGKRFGKLGRLAGRIAEVVERHVLRSSAFVITISPEHTKHLPQSVRKELRYEILENWANIESTPVVPHANAWAACNGLDRTRNVVYSGTLGFKHDLDIFAVLANALAAYRDVRLVIVSSGQAADTLRKRAAEEGWHNTAIIPFQKYEDFPNVLGSASVLIAPLETAAGSFCVPSKILSYLCAGRPSVVSLDPENPAAQMITRSAGGCVVEPGSSESFVAAVRTFLDDPDLAARTGGAARAFAEQTFNLEKVEARFLEILNRAKVNAPHREAAPIHQALAATFGTSN